MAPDSNLESLEGLADHIASFTASCDDGKLIDSTPGIKPQHASISRKIFENATLLVAKLKEKVGEDSEPVVKVTVSYPEYNYAFTVSGDKLYGVKRANS
ncbi:3877_t:CDS:2 [Paraglomus occultum]|uniref:3877_t:CDS:1 n=1 Tax=Paraglomus occultum TaxID=144539 RepID=A0A9N8VQ86_9GLOM|nr:3877_t:CDS:2 [Paraglomus occultum]